MLTFVSPHEQKLECCIGSIRIASSISSLIPDDLTDKIPVL